MGLKSVELLEEAYRHILGDLEIAFNTLLEESESDFQCSLVASNPYTGNVHCIEKIRGGLLDVICRMSMERSLQLYHIGAMLNDLDYNFSSLLKDTW